MWLKRIPGIRTAVAATVLGAAALPLALSAGSATAAAPTYPLLGPSTVYTQQTYGTVQPAGANGSFMTLNVALNGVTANATYYVRECSLSLITNQASCVGDNTDVVQTNSTGSGTATLSFQSIPSVDVVQVTAAGYSAGSITYGIADVYQAAITANAPTIPGAGITYPSTGTFIGTNGAVSGPGFGFGSVFAPTFGSAFGSVGVCTGSQLAALSFSFGC